LENKIQNGRHIKSIRTNSWEMINTTRVFLMVSLAMMGSNQVHLEQEIHITKLKPGSNPHKPSMQGQ
jgi:hypothetical protein